MKLCPAVEFALQVVVGESCELFAERRFLAAAELSAAFAFGVEAVALGTVGGKG